MKQLLTIFLLIGSTLQAQKITKSDLKALNKKQDSLGILSWRTINEISSVNRLISDSVFTKVFVRALSIKNSFYYGFDSVQIAKTYAPDSSFKIFTWQVERGKDKIRQRGVIQYKTADGKMKITPLLDNSEFMDDLTQVSNSRNWVGAIYYKILLNEYQGKKYYTLIGLDENNSESNKKWVEVLTFNENNEPIFGGPYIKHTTQGMRNRFGIEYKKDARVKLNWDEDQQMIIFDHLSSETGFVNQKKTFVSDGDYEGFKWENGMWVHLEKVMCNCPLRKIEDPLLGNPEVGEPLFDKEGKKVDKKPTPPTPPVKKSGGGQ
jgi:hypothetical protein